MKKLGFLLADIHDFTSEEAQQLLHNKFVVVIGDSNYRAIYKDLIYFLQTNKMLTNPQLKQKDEKSFANDCLVEFNGQHTRNDYRLVRQYCTRHHLVRFYFITRVYSPDVESILNDLRAGLEAGLVPDVVLLHSCLWDLNRYRDYFPTEPPVQKAIREYRQNAKKLFQALHNIFPSNTLIIWGTAMSIRKNARGYVVELQHRASARDMIEANFYSSKLADQYQLDVLDLHYHFRFLEHLHAADGTHWDYRAHRYITKLLLTHIAEAWQVELEKRRPQVVAGMAEPQQPSPWRTMLPAPPPCLWASSPAHGLVTSSRAGPYTCRNAKDKKRPRGRWRQGCPSAWPRAPVQHNESHLSGLHVGPQYELEPLPDPDLSDPRNSSHTQPRAGYDKRPINPSEQARYPQPIPSYSSHGSPHVDYDACPLSSSEQDQCLQPHCSNYSHGPLHTGHIRPISLMDQDPPPNPSYSGAPTSIGFDGRPKPSWEQGQCLQSHPQNYFHGPHGAEDDGKNIGLLGQAGWSSLNPGSGVLLQHNARSGPWVTGGYEDDPGFQQDMEENHPSGFSLPEPLTHEEGWAPYRFPQGAWAEPRRRHTGCPQLAYNRRWACAPYANRWDSPQDPCYGLPPSYPMATPSGLHGLIFHQGPTWQD